MLPRSSYHPARYLENKVKQLFPALETTAVLYRKNKELLVSVNQSEKSLTESEAPLLQKWRNRSSAHAWMRPEDFPWLEKLSFKTQLRMQDEHENRLLLLCFISPEDSMRDILALEFPRNSKFFGLQKELNDLTTDEKMIVGEMLHKLLDAEYRELFTERTDLLQMRRFRQLKEYKSGTEEAFRHYFERTCTDMLRELQLSFPVHVASEAAELLALHSAGHEELNELIRKALRLALLLEPEPDEIVLNTLHIESVLNNREAGERSYPSTDEKVSELLYRYEEAATKAHRNNHPVTGKSVARFLEPSISPPAVSESLKKYASRIEMLLHQFPDQWPLIRKSLKPLKELDDRPFSVRKAI